ncbi:MAG TPA: substrate-binding domain-containing protein [Candidatus Bathyarchaeia archaeon]|jgi:DNA-binding LacI/PurR family transcriptional regulator|nr:substrate-binding domain-containing protein [Candidatus Bathyarchaeia archaeon]
MENPFVLDICRTLESDAHASGLEVVVANTDYQSQQLLASVQLMLGLRVAGLAVIVSEMEPHLIETVVSSRIPVVFYDAGTPQKNITNIRVDYRKGIEKTVSYLNSLGHRRMAFIGHHSALGPIGERCQAFLESLHRCSPDHEAKIFSGPDGLDGGRQAARELLDSGFWPTAILCVNDFMAVGVIRELREEGLQIPRDVSVTGFDNIKLAEFCCPPLTTVHIPREQIGHIIFDSILGGAQNEHAPGREIVINPELVLRDSTGPSLKT